MGAYVRGLQHTSLAYLFSPCHTLLLFVSMHTLTPNVQFVFPVTDCVRCGTVPDIRPVTNCTTPKRENRAKPQ
jgi:hypothetical protein